MRGIRLARIAVERITTYTYDYRQSSDGGEAGRHGYRDLYLQRVDQRIGMKEGRRPNLDGLQRHEPRRNALRRLQRIGHAADALRLRARHGQRRRRLMSFSREPVPAGQRAWYLTDKLDSVRDDVSSSGSVLDHVVYDSFGNVLTETNATNGDRFKFTGMEYDATTGVFFDRARYYDAETGRFTVQDPTGFAARDTNLYRYAANDPNNATDQTGTQEQRGDSGGSGGSGPQGAFGMTLGQQTAMELGAITGMAIAADILLPINLVPGGGSVAYVVGVVVGGLAGGIYGYMLGAGLGDSPADIVDGCVSGLVGGLAGGLTGGEVGMAVLWTYGKMGLNTRPVDGGGDESVQRQRELEEQAKQDYPNKANKQELHHITPKYLGGPANGETIRLNAAYHQKITNEFRRLWPYGSAKPNPEELETLLNEVYKNYPLPPLPEVPPWG